LATAIIICLGSWASMALAFSPILPPSYRNLAAIIIGLTLLFAIFWRKSFYFPTILGILLVLLAWYNQVPSNDRDWQKDLSRLAWSEQKGDEVVIHNVRDFHYRSETDFDQNYVTKKVKLSELSSIDLFASYWAGKDIAHIFVSFGFANKDYINFSIEVRKTKTQSYSTIDGFFRNYELIYVVAEERDVVALRTIYRQPNEQVYMYRLKYFKENAIKIFQQYLANMNSLVTKPEFYNTATTNCTTQVLANAQQATKASRLTYDWRLLLSGHTPEYFYSKGALDSSYSLEELTSKGLLNPRAQLISEAREFSARLRESVPKPEPFQSPP
jgi:hypothetical protein